MLFADVRGSSVLAESMSAIEFSRLINRFFVTATDILIRVDAMVDRLIGDEVVGLFIPGLAGQDHPRKAINAAQSLLRQTGHGDPEGPWVPVGVGIHTGIAFVGVVGGTDNRPTDFTALGTNVNIASHLASQAGAGEIIISDAAYRASRLELGSLESRQLAIKGQNNKTDVWVLRS
jgi:adenylate cyclase